MKRTILIFICTLMFSCNQVPHEDYYKFPYLVMMSNDDNWTNTGILVDSFKMVSKEEIVIYRNNTRSTIHAKTINVKQNQYYTRD